MSGDTARCYNCPTPPPPILSSREFSSFVLSKNSHITNISECLLVYAWVKVFILLAHLSRRFKCNFDIQKWAPLTRGQCQVSDTQVTVKARGPLVAVHHVDDSWPSQVLLKLDPNGRNLTIRFSYQILTWPWSKHSCFNTLNQLI